MSERVISAADLIMKSSWSQNRGFPGSASVDERTIKFNYGIPARATINSVVFVATVTLQEVRITGDVIATGRRTVDELLTANNIHFGSGTNVNLTVPTEKSGSYEVGLKFRAVAVPEPGYDDKNINCEGSVRLTGIRLIIRYTEETLYHVITKVSPAGTGNLAAVPSEAYAGDTVHLYPNPNAEYKLASYTKTAGSITGNDLTMPASDVTVTANFERIKYKITVTQTTGGTVTADKTEEISGGKVKLTATPATGYMFTRFTRTGGGSIDPATGTLTMTSADVTVSAVFELITYEVSVEANPAGAGTVTSSKSLAYMGNSVTLTQSAAAGYYFIGWTSSPSVSISNNAFTMPASNVKVTANYAKRSTAKLNTASLTGGGTAVLTISTENKNYTHKYNLSFGSGMETGLTDIPAGITSQTINIPAGWSSGIPNANSKANGTLTLYTYRNGTLIGSDTITGLTYNVPSTELPTIGTISTAILRTVGGKTYANVGNYYVQGHSGVSISTSASGVYGSTITEMTLAIGGYSGAGYSASSTNGSISLSSGLLTKNGATTITVTAKDSRGRTVTKTASITVSAYHTPTISEFRIWRVLQDGTAHNMGDYAKYRYAYSITSLGSNAATVTLKEDSSGTTVSSPAATGDLLPGNRRTFVITNRYTYTLTVTDAFETTTLQVAVPTGAFIIYVDSTGKKISFGMATTRQAAGDRGVFEISPDMDIYVGNMTMKQYIQGVINGTI